MREGTRTYWAPGKGQREEWPSVVEQWGHGAYDRRLNGSRGFIWKFWKGGVYGIKAWCCEDWDRTVRSDGDARDVEVSGGRREHGSLH